MGHNDHVLKRWWDKVDGENIKATVECSQMSQRISELLGFLQMLSPGSLVDAPRKSPIIRRIGQQTINISADIRRAFVIRLRSGPALVEGGPMSMSNTAASL